MAGVWIKVEHATADKPEITRAAEMLGISRREALGLFFDFWIWLDNNLSGSCPGVVRNVSRKSLDQSLACPGFAATLEAIGWGEFDEKAWTLRITNAERHNGNTAKSRALDSKRKSEKRREMSGSEPDNSRNREEKRREDITTKSKASTARKRAARAPKVPIPADFAISDRVREWAAKHGYDQLEEHFAAFLLKVEKAGYVYASWDAALMEAIRDDWAELRKPERLNGHSNGGTAWWESEQATLDKGRELDMVPYGGEGWPEFRARLRQRMRAQRGASAS